MKVTKEGLELNKIEYAIVMLITIVAAFALLLGICNILVILWPGLIENFERATGI